MINDGHNGDAYKPALITLKEEAEILGIKPTRLRSARKHIKKHPLPVAKIRKTDHFHTHSFYEYIANNNAIDDLRAVELKMRRGYLANVKKHSKKRVVRNTTNRTAPLASFNVARAW